MSDTLSIHIHIADTGKQFKQLIYLFSFKKKSLKTCIVPLTCQVLAYLSSLTLPQSKCGLPWYRKTIKNRFKWFSRERGRQSDTGKISCRDRCWLNNLPNTQQWQRLKKRSCSRWQEHSGALVRYAEGKSPLKYSTNPSSHSSLSNLKSASMHATCCCN